MSTPKPAASTSRTPGPPAGSRERACEDPSPNHSRPRNPGNIGACARAMGNFGVSDLVVVDPYPPIWRETRGAPDAEAIVRKARKTATLTQAVRGCSRVLGTSSFAHRRLEQAILPLPQIHDTLSKIKPKERVAIVFGSERAGLSNEELARCEAVIRVPMARPGVSMNLAQAVAVVLYEWTKVRPRAAASRAEAGGNEEVVEAWIRLAEAAGYPPGYTPAARAGRIRRSMADVAMRPETSRFLISFSRWMWKKIYLI